MKEKAIIFILLIFCYGVSPIKNISFSGNGGFCYCVEENMSKCFSIFLIEGEIHCGGYDGVIGTEKETNPILIVKGTIK
ncbi:MAG: hypothetical protein AABY22_22975 [Nanoarchaeota archaeon]